jgi:hypothetical protein
MCHCLHLLQTIDEFYLHILVLETMPVISFLTLHLVFRIPLYDRLNLLSQSFPLILQMKPLHVMGHGAFLHNYKHQFYQLEVSHPL